MKNAKKILLIIFVTALLFPCISLTSAQAGTQVFYVPDETKQTPVNLINGSFETPHTYNYNGYIYIPMEDVPGWSVVPVSSSNYSKFYAYWMEVCGVNAGMSGAEGNNWDELIGDFPQRLYQSVTTVPGYRLYWQFAHEAKAIADNADGKGVDVSNFYVRATGSPTTAPVPKKLIQTATNNGLAWGYYRGTYTVPVGQTSTELIFVPISWATNNIQNGNYVDDILFQTGSKLIAKKSIATSASDDSTAYKGEIVTITTAVTNWGETDSSRCVYRDVLSDGLDYVSGSAMINGVSASGLATFNSATDELRVNIGTGATAGTANTNGGVIKGSRNTGTSGTTGQGETVTVTYRAKVTASAGYVVKSQSSITYNDKNYESYNASDITSYSSVSGKTVSSSDETTYVNRFTVVDRSLSGRVWYDADADGMIDTSETRVSGLTVSVYANTDTTYTTPVNDINGAALTTTTSSTGTYSFSAIPAGTYKIVVTTPSGYIVTVKTTSTDNDAIESGNKSVVSGVAMTAALTTTNTQNIVTNMDIGFATKRTLTGRIWFDSDADGMIDASETRAWEYTVTLYKNTDTTYTTPVNDIYGSPLLTVADKSGVYSFSAIPAGTYKAVVTTPTGYIVTIKTASTDNDAVASGTNAVISDINLSSAASATNMDFGFATNRTLTGRAWIDFDSDGTIDSGETMISAMTVGIYASTDTTYTTPVNNIYGTALTTTTNSSGVYNFSAIPVGTYKVVVTTPTAYVVTVLANDNNAVASGTNAVISGVDLSSATSVTNMDFGFTSNRTVTGRAWYDMDTDGTIDASETKISGLTVGLYDSSVTTYTTPAKDIYGNALTTTTSSTGTYNFSAIPYGTYKAVVTTPTGYVVTTHANDNDAVASGTYAVINGINTSNNTSITNMDFGFTINRTLTGRAWYDTDFDGTLDTGETMVPGLTVGLYANTDTTYTTPVNNLYGTPLTTTTNSSGVYSFSAIPVGIYKAVVTTPSGYTVTVQANDNDAVASGTKAVINGIALSGPSSMTNMDFGFAESRTMSGRTWYDSDTDGTLDPGEALINGLTVGLYADTDTTYTTPVKDIYGNNLTTTTSTGAYSFSNIPSGTYKAVVRTPNQVIVTVLANDNNAVASGAYAVISGINLSSAASATNMDFGFTDNRTLTGRAWYDTDFDGTLDTGETMVPGLTVGLYANTDTTYTTPVNNIFGTPLTTTTNSSGVYSFSAIPAGIYKAVVTTPSGYTVTVQANDNDAVASGAKAVISGIDFTSAVDVSYKDFGFTNTYSITLSKIIKGTLADPHKDFTFTITLTGVTDPLPYTGTSTITGVAAPANGTITSGGTITLRHGQSITISGVPAGTVYSITESNASGYTQAVTNNNASGKLAGDINVQFVNTKNEVPPTGIFMDIIPYVMMVVLVAGIIALLMAIRRKTVSDEKESKKSEAVYTSGHHEYRGL